VPPPLASVATPMPEADWTPGPGIIEMPDGSRFRGRGLRKLEPDGERPAFGLYLLNREPPAMDWESRWLVWPDFRLPRDPMEAGRALADAHARAATARVEIACGGGRGRTGTALACIAVLAGVPAEDAVSYVRLNYDPRAVETPFQRRFVRRFTPAGAG
jgi:protein-tyrosine phosphatase